MGNSKQNSENPVTIVTPERSALLQGHANLIKVLVRVQAPDVNPNADKARPAYRLALVLDRSGSMEGRPLLEAKRCASFIVDQLREDDLLAVVAFDSHVRVMAGVGPAGNKQHIREAISGIHAGGNTDLHGGWKAGAEELARVVQAGGLNRVILLSDGNANSGLTDLQEICSECGRLAEHSITTSTYGLGRSFNEDLMVAMAKAGRGNHYYGETANDLFEPFFEEFALISNLYLRGLQLSVECPEGVGVKVLNNFQEIVRGVTWRLPDLAYESEAWCLLELNIPQHRVETPGELEGLIKVRVSGMSVDGQKIESESVSLTLPVLPVSAWDAVAPDELVFRRAAEVEASTYLDRIREAADQGDWGRIETLVAEARRRFSGSPWLADILRTIDGYVDSRDLMFLRKQAMYSSEKLKSRLSAKEELVAMAAEARSPAYLRRKGAQGRSAFDDDNS